MRHLLPVPDIETAVTIRARNDEARERFTARMDTTTPTPRTRDPRGAKKVYGDRVEVTVRVDPELRSALHDFATENGVSVNTAARVAIERLLAEPEPLATQEENAA